jgi:hypothetical protein
MKENTAVTQMQCYGLGDTSAHLRRVPTLLYPRALIKSSQTQDSYNFSPCHVYILMWTNFHVVLHYKESVRSPSPTQRRRPQKHGSYTPKDTAIRSP